METLRFSSGSTDLDRLLEELCIGDNVVFSVDDPVVYVPFVAALAHRDPALSPQLVYARSNGMLDRVVSMLPNVQVMELALLLDEPDPQMALEQEMRAVGRGVHYIFDPLESLSPGFCVREELGNLFTRICPLLYALDTVAYWAMVRQRYSDHLIAAVKDCTQVFIEVRYDAKDLVLTPLKVSGRYSERMFRPHRLTDEKMLSLETLAVGVGDELAYSQMLEDKNRELAEIRDALDSSNRELQDRNRSLAEQQERTRVLNDMLTDVLALLQMGQEIASSLVLEQVRQEGVDAAKHLFDASDAVLVLNDDSDTESLTKLLNMFDQRVAVRQLEELVSEVEVSREIRSVAVGEKASMAVAPLLSRAGAAGYLAVAARGLHLHRPESRASLEYLSSVIGVAIDNARLYAELEEQGEQLRSWVDRVISTEESNNRQFALDLHDGLVQLVVAAYQHLQSARAWRERDPNRQYSEIESGTRLVREAIHESRRLIAQLRPAGLDDFGLVHALRAYCTRMTQDTGITIDTDFAPSWPSLPASLETALFRVVQEGLTNVQKHACSDRVRVHLYNESDVLGIEVADDGQGFDLDDVVVRPERGMHIGLVGIRERVRLWGGTCYIQSRPGCGTTVSITIPMPQKSEVRP